MMILDKDLIEQIKAISIETNQLQSDKQIALELTKLVFPPEAQKNRASLTDIKKADEVLAVFNHLLSQLHPSK